MKEYGQSHCVDDVVFTHSLTAVIELLSSLDEHIERKGGGSDGTVPLNKAGIISLHDAEEKTNLDSREPDSWTSVSAMMNDFELCKE